MFVGASARNIDLGALKIERKLRFIVFDIWEQTYG
jgi:hypothetical protein